MFYRKENEWFWFKFKKNPKRARWRIGRGDWSAGGFRFQPVLGGQFVVSGEMWWIFVSSTLDLMVKLRNFTAFLNLRCRKKLFAAYLTYFADLSSTRVLIKRDSPNLTKLIFRGKISVKNLRFDLFLPSFYYMKQNAVQKCDRDCFRVRKLLLQEKSIPTYISGLFYL